MGGLLMDIFPRKLYCHDCHRYVDVETENYVSSFFYCFECDATLLDDYTGKPLESDGHGGFL